jgi:hypothetical protein
MILRPKSSARHISALTAAAAPVSTVPTWMRRAIPDAQSLAGKDLEDLALAAGAAIGALDAVVRRQERWAGAWRQRLALAAAAATAKQAGRVEDEAALRDAVLLTKFGDDVGPAGSMLLAWRQLAGTPAEDLLTEESIAAVLEDLGLRRDDGGQRPGGRSSTAFRQVSEWSACWSAPSRPPSDMAFARAFGCWLADALLAQRLGWAHAVPLLGAEAAFGASARPRRSGSQFCGDKH